MSTRPIPASPMRPASISPRSPARAQAPAHPACPASPAHPAPAKTPALPVFLRAGLPQGLPLLLAILTFTFTLALSLPLAAHAADGGIAPAAVVEGPATPPDAAILSEAPLADFPADALPGDGDAEPPAPGNGGPAGDADAAPSGQDSPAPDPEPADDPGPADPNTDEPTPTEPPVPEPTDPAPPTSPPAPATGEPVAQDPGPDADVAVLFPADAVPEPVETPYLGGPYLASVAWAIHPDAPDKAIYVTSADLQAELWLRLPNDGSVPENWFSKAVRFSLDVDSYDAQSDILNPADLSVAGRALSGKIVEIGQSYVIAYTPDPDPDLPHTIRLSLSPQTTLAQPFSPEDPVQILYDDLTQTALSLQTVTK